MLEIKITQLELNMIRKLIKFSSVPKVNSCHINFRYQTCNFCWLNVPSVCSYQQNKFFCSNPVLNSLLKPSSFNVVKDYRRFKSKGKKSRTRQYDSDSEEEEEENEADADGYDGDGNKLRQIKLKSMRIDALLGKGAGLTRRKIEELFLGSRFRFNGQPLSKKSAEFKPGDTLEICSDPVDTGGTTEVLTKLTVIKTKPLEDAATFLVTYTLHKAK